MYMNRVCVQGDPGDKDLWLRLPLSSWTHLLSNRTHFCKPPLNPRWSALACGAKPSSHVAAWCGVQGGKWVEVLNPADVAAEN